MPRSPISLCIAILAFAAFFAVGVPAQGDTGSVSIKSYLPDTWPTDGSVDLKPMIETALAQNTQLFFPGSTDAKAPVIYPISTGLVIPENRQIQFAPNARFLRIPSRRHC